MKTKTKTKKRMQLCMFLSEKIFFLPEGMKTTLSGLSHGHPHIKLRTKCVSCSYSWIWDVVS